MDFNFSEEQNILRQSVRSFMEKEFSWDSIRSLLESEEGFSPDIWKKMADLGWLGLVLPEGFGGIAGSFMDLILIMEEMGYRRCPGPFFSTVFLGALPVLKHGSAEQKEKLLPLVAQGEAKLTMAVAEANSGFESGEMAVKAVKQGEDYVLNGVKFFVPDAHISDYLLVAAKTADSPQPDESITLFIVPAKTSGISCVLLNSLTWDKQCEVTLNEIKVGSDAVLGEVNGGWRIITETLDDATVALCAEMAGGAEYVLKSALEYAKQRIQFDRPIGSFQAIQHYFADMWIDINAARMLTYKSAAAITSGRSAQMEIAMAKARTGQSYRKVTMLGHQIFGGIGFTLEHEMHFYHRRAIAGDLTFGGSSFHKEKVASLLGL